MAATPSDMATPVPDDSNRARSPDVPDLSTVDAKLSHLATNLETTTSDYMDTLRTMIATLSSLIDFYDPSGVFIKRHSDPPADRAPGHEPSRRSEPTEPLFSHSETPGAPSRPDDAAVHNRENLELSDSDIFSLAQSLKDNEASKRPLVAATVPLSVLRAEYASSAFIAKIDWLSAHGWTGLRRSRGDGDCFYRSMAFAYVERIMDAPDQNYAAATSLSTLEMGVEDLQLVGFDPAVFNDFFEVLRDLILNVVQPDLDGNLMTPLSMLERFQDLTVSNSVVAFFRLLTSAHIRLHADDFAPFLFDPETFEPVDVAKFCEAQVEATGKEADHPQIQGLCRALKVAVDIAYVDSSTGIGGGETAEDGKVDFVRFETEGSDGANPITLLYRPGHYDILEKKSSVPSEKFVRSQLRLSSADYIL